MNYNNENIRRQDRLLDEKLAIALLKQGEYGVLSMQCKDEGVYAIPINYIWNNEQSIYIHCATIGRKLNCIDFNNQVSFCIVGKTNVISNKFTTGYESVVLNCTAQRKLSDSEKMDALNLLLDKYSPNDKVIGKKYAQKSFHRTEILRLDISSWSGKCKVV